jgi:hypothetical protein
MLDRNLADSAQSHAEAALASPSRDPELLSLAFARLALAAQKTGDVDAFRRGVQGTIVADSVAGIAGASVWARSLTAPVARAP